MKLNKRTYTNQQTVITAENLNEIQDAIIYLQEHGGGGGGTWGSITGNLEDQTDLAEVLSEQSSQIASLDEGKIDTSAQAAKTSAMTEAVGIDANGKLWSKPGSGGGGGKKYVYTDDGDGNITISEVEV